MPTLSTYTGSSISKEDWAYALDLVSDWQSYPKTEGLASDIGVLARAFAHLKVCYDERVRVDRMPFAANPMRWNPNTSRMEPYNYTDELAGRSDIDHSAGGPR
jgi:hypothetical protein